MSAEFWYLEQIILAHSMYFRGDMEKKENR
jgi:hypothetical protein